MIKREDLKKIVMLTYLTDDMLERLIPIIDILKFDRGEIIFRENEPTDRFYMLKSGHVLLEQSISDQVTACVSAIKPGFSFGWSAMVREASVYTVQAICKEPSETFSFKEQKIRKLFEQDPRMGLRMHERFLVIVKKRLDVRTRQFREAIRNHPDMQSLFGTCK